MDVMFYETFIEEKEAIKSFLPESVRAEFTDKTIQELAEGGPPAALISIRTQSAIPAPWGKKIKGVLTRSQGYDHLIAFRQESGAEIVYGYLGSYCARAVAEQAILMMMALLRKLKKQEKQFGSFARDGLTGGECCGRHVLVIGVGNIGSEMVDLATGLRMEVCGVDIAPKLNGIEYVSLSEGLAWADIALCALPLTPQTDRLLNYASFQKAKPGLIFVNVARGEISPVNDLKKLLQEGLMGGVGLDVYPEEGVLADALRAQKEGKVSGTQDVLELSRQDNVIFTPHNAFNTKEAVEKKASLSAEAVVSFLRKATFPQAVPAT